MSLISDLIDGMLEGTGWATGVAVVLGVAAVGARRGRPLVKEVMKGYVLVSDRVKELVAETGEQLADLYAEARAEHETGAPTLVTMSAAGAAPEAASRRRGRPPRAASEAGAAAEPGAAAPRRRGRPPRAAAAEAGPADAAASAPRRRGRPPRAEGAAAPEGAGGAAPRRARRPRAAAEGEAAPEQA